MAWIEMPHERVMRELDRTINPVGRPYDPSRGELLRSRADAMSPDYSLQPISKSWHDVDTSPPVLLPKRLPELDSFDYTLGCLGRKQKDEIFFPLLESNVRPKIPFAPILEPIYEPPHITETVLKYGRYADDTDSKRDYVVPYIPQPEPMFIPDNLWKKIGKNGRFSDD